MIDDERKKEQVIDSGEINKENSRSMEFSVNGLPEEIDEEAEALRNDNEEKTQDIVSNYNEEAEALRSDECGELKIEEASNFDEEAEALGIKEYDDEEYFNNLEQLMKEESEASRSDDEETTEDDEEFYN
jgi:hypothetical protein